MKLKDGTIDYLIAEREPVKTNLIAHIRNNLMNETFGICENRYKATGTDEECMKLQVQSQRIFELSGKTSFAKEKLLSAMNQIDRKMTENQSRSSK